MRDQLAERVGRVLFETGPAVSIPGSFSAVVGATPAASGTGITRFVAAVLVFGACLGTTWYALVTARHEPHDTLVWRYVALSTAVGGVFSALLVIETTSPGVGTVVVAFRLLAQLFFAVFLALSLRELYYAQPATSAAGARISLSTARRIETGFMLLALIQFPIVVWVGPTVLAQVILALAAGAFTIYGVSFGQAIRARRLTRGTVLDATVTYTIAVLLCVGAVSVTEGAVIVSIPEPAVGGAVNVLLVMIGTFLISLIIRLKRSADAVGGAR
ncbi:hypothetical protein [Halorubrum sp. SD626R]|uniref:hypothetical protein n=1 Tax=Halorubrum sp. SD626R TaxID=1419722 RepID=UPI000A5D04E6|nr:hypothetical protein [Halorubrum sp. SD626R]